MDRVKALEEYVKTLEGLIDEADVAGTRYEETGTALDIASDTSWHTVSSSDLERITLFAGTWVVHGWARTPSDADGRRALCIYDVTNEARLPLSVQNKNAVNGAPSNMQTMTTVTVTDDTVITLQVLQNSGTARDIQVGIEAVLIATDAEIEGGSGVSSYNELSNKPQIEGVTLVGDKSFEDFGLVVPTKTSDLTNDSDFVEDANYVHTDNNYTSTEKSKLAGIANGAEANVQSDWNQTNTSQDDYIKNKPAIPSKTSDLTNDSGFITSETDPVFTASAAHGITSSDISDWNNKSDFSGDYDDLTNKPTIPSKTSDLANDSGYSSVSFTRYTTSGTNIADIEIDGTTTKIYAPTSGGGGVTDYDQLTSRPQINSTTLTGNKSSSDLGVADEVHTHTKSDITDFPTIPTNTSDLNNDSGFISAETDPVFSASAASGITSSDISTWNGKSDFSGDYDDLTNKPSIPSKTSDLNNDSHFIAKGDFEISSHTTSNQTISGGSTMSAATQTFTKTGYYPLAISGWVLNGSNATNLTLVHLYISSQASGSVGVTYRIHNAGSSQSTSTNVRVYILWIKE